MVYHPIRSRTGSHAVIGANQVRLYDLEFDGGRYDAVIALGIDGTWDLERVAFAPQRDDRRIGSGPTDLYPNGTLDGVRAEVQQVVSIGAWLYASVRYANGDQRLDVWDLGDPLSPRLVDQLDYGNYLNAAQDYDRLPNLAVRQGHLIVQSAQQLDIYRPDGDGIPRAVELDAEHQIELPILHSVDFAGHMAVVTQGDYQTQFFSLTNPARPFSVEGSGETVSRPEGTLSGTFMDEPASLTVEGTQARLTVYHSDLEAHLEGFWDAKLALLFPGAALDRPIGALISDAVNGLGLTERLERLYLQLPNQLTVSAEATLDQRIAARC